ncbi:MAG TPA: MerR family transcriptional regulator [Alphaproteobacteria bacterium]|jgi:DNA-binding transcriptional MerR regulator|nr:MerR family transcriptional regulator [Alphaproteobacteria bacterium]
MADPKARPDARRNGKSPDAFRTISEVAEELDVPQHVLRFWESKFSQVRPLKRGGGRRYYRPEDIDLLRGIRHLLYVDGYTIKGVQKLLRESGAKVVGEAGRNGGPVPTAAAAQTDPPPAPEGGQDERLAAIAEELAALRDLLRRRRS